MEWWQQKEIIVSLIGMASAIAVAAITAVSANYKVSKAKTAVKQAESEMRFQRAALDFGTFISDWAETHKEIKNLLENTEIDRFIMFRAWNGENAPRWTTNVFQMRLGNQEPIQYVHFDLDDDYVSRLRRIVRDGILYFKVCDIPESSIKHVYDAEGVLSTVWCHILSERVINSNAATHTYCSFSSHITSDLDPATITKCNILAGRLKGVANSFNNG